MPQLQHAALPRAEVTDLAVDHIGVVVHDLAAEVAAWRGCGFAVSDPVALMGVDGEGRPVPLGQASAHVVFENSYVELSSPDPGSGNHLEPYLAHGEGVRILVLATADAEAARSSVGAPEVRSASRRVIIDGKAQTARFRWFPLPADLVPATLSAVVEHLTPDLVFHPSLVVHPNGARQLTRILAAGRRDDLLTCDVPPPRTISGLLPPLLALSDGAGILKISAFTVSTATGGEIHCSV
ncbi:MAG: VOC family protein [Hyphomicrobiales bacterium]|nr:VOC family protein [Hyphomicrobiales bacterium]